MATYKPNKAPLGERSLITVSRLRRIREMAKRASDDKLRALYLELYGAQAGTSIPTERVRASLKEAVDELLNDVEDEPDEPDVSDLL